ncbi:MAG: TlpA family protein disulfide reductase [Kiritimatiellae bacterium]|nr:TlpA family protein disulfide reductase [Kiritimatiellia bacterium]
MKVRSALLVVAVLSALGVAGVEWHGIGEENYIAGPHIKSPASLAGKVVLVDEWGHRCPPCRALLPRMQQIWESFKHKPFVLIGSHRQDRNESSIKALVEKNDLHYPIYQGAGISNEPENGGGLPFIYVVNHRGQIVYSGRSERDATEAVVNALDEVGKLPSLVGDVKLVKFKSLEKQLVIGKPIQAIVKKLEGATNSKNQPVAEEASALLGAIDKARGDLQEEIEYLKGTNPKEALRLIKLMKATWPKEAEEAYKSQVAGLIAKAKEQEAAEKAAAATAKGATNFKR